MGRFIPATSLMTPQQEAAILSSLSGIDALRFRAGMPLYDTQSVATSGNTSLAFFSNNGGGGSNLETTNLPLANQVPASTDHVLKRVMIKAKPSTGLQSISAASTYAADLLAALFTGGTSVTIGGRVVMQVPSLLDLAGAGLDGFAAVSGTASSAFNQSIAYAREHESMSIQCKPWYGLPGQTPIAVQTNWGTSPAPSATVKVVCYLAGDNFDCA